MIRPFTSIVVVSMLLLVGAVAYADGAQVPFKDKRVLEVSIQVAAQPFDLVFSADGETAYVSHVEAGQLSQIWGNQVKRTVAIGSRPTGMAMSKDGKTLYVGLMGESKLALVDVATLKVRKKVPLPGSPIGVALPAHERGVVEGVP